MNEKEKPYIPIYTREQIELDYFNYNSPIKIIQDIQNNLRIAMDNEIYEAVIDCNIDVDKQELIKALMYDRNQYEQGFKDAKERYEKALDKTCEELVKMCQQTNCNDCHFVKVQIDCDNDCQVQGNYTPVDWKEWCLRDE